MSKLLSAYSGERAANYDSMRSGSSRWKNEVDAMERYLRDIRPATIVDCPFGTGRWIPQYLEFGVRTIGIDLSTDMLKEARQKLDTTGASPDQFHLLAGSIFELSKIQLPFAPQLIACIRFVNWVAFDDVRKVIANLTTLPGSEMILGASVIPRGTSSARALKMRIALAITNWRQRGAPAQYVHTEGDLLELLGSHGWTVLERIPTFENASRVNYFYRLKRA